MGASKAEVLESTPKELEYLGELDRLNQMKKDRELWQMGIYIERAVAVAVEHNLAGRKAQSKYFEKPIFEDELKRRGKDSVDKSEIKRQRELFVATLENMKANWELEQKRKQLENGGKTE